MSAGIAVFLRLASPSGGRLHAPGGSWLLAGLITLGAVLVAVAAASGLGHRPGSILHAPGRLARNGHRDHMGFRGRRHQGAQLAPRRWHRRRLLDLVAVRAAGRRGGDDAAGLARAGGRAAGRLPARVHHPGPAVGCLLGVFLFGEHIRTSPWDLAGEALALALVIAGAWGLSRSCFILGEFGDPSCLPAGFQAQARGKRPLPGAVQLGSWPAQQRQSELPGTGDAPTPPGRTAQLGEHAADAAGQRGVRQAGDPRLSPGHGRAGA